MLLKEVTIPFNRESFLQCHQAIWSLSSKKFIGRNILYTCLAILVFITGLELEKNNGFPIETVVGGGYLVYLVLWWIGFFERRFKFFKKVKAVSRLYAQEQMSETYTFWDDGLEYKDFEKSFRFKWHLFQVIHNYQDTIIITLKNGGIAMFAISKSEVGEETFTELLYIFKEKVG